MRFKTPTSPIKLANYIFKQLHVATNGCFKPRDAGSAVAGWADDITNDEGMAACHALADLIADGEGVCFRLDTFRYGDIRDEIVTAYERRVKERRRDLAAEVGQDV